jgi:hypothetical protein
MNFAHCPLHVCRCVVFVPTSNKGSRCTTTTREAQRQAPAPGARWQYAYVYMDAIAPCEGVLAEVVVMASCSEQVPYDVPCR